MSLPNLSALAVRERSVTLFFLLLSIVAGLMAFLSLGRAEDPAIRMQMLLVSAIWPGASNDEMENIVVRRLEKKLQELENLHRLQTSIRDGRADIAVEFEDFTSNQKLIELQYDVRKRMQDVARDLPPGVIGPLVNDDFADIYFSLVAVTAPGLPMRDLTREAEHLRDRLRLLPGILKVNLLGEHPERMYVDFDNVKLVNLGISPLTIFDTIEAWTRVYPTGFLETQGPRLMLRPPQKPLDAATLGNVPLRIGHTVVPLRDVATIRQGYEAPLAYRVRANGESALLLGVVMAPGQNGLALGTRIHEFLAAERSRLPAGITIRQISDQFEAIEAAVSLFQAKFLVAVAVVMGVGFLALGWRAGLIVGIIVPATLGLTFVLMNVAGVNLDRITLGALIIALGLLVDDAIIAIEMMLVKLEQGWSKVKAASHAWHVTAAPMLWGTLITMFGFVPIGFAKSGVGEYAGNIFWVLAFSLLISWLVAVTFAPYLGVQLLPARAAGGHGGDVYQSPFYQRLRGWVTRAVDRRGRTIAITLGLLGVAILAMATVVEKQFFPGSDRPEVVIGLSLPAGTGIERTEAVVERLEGWLAGRHDVRHYTAYVGAGAPRFFISISPEYPDTAFAKMVVVTNGQEARDQLIHDLQQQVADGMFPEARLRISALLFGPPIQWPVSFRVIGPDKQQLRKIAADVRGIMQANPHIVDPTFDWDQRVPRLHLDVDDTRLAELGITPRDLAMQMRFRTQGVPLGSLTQDMRQIEIWGRAVEQPGEPPAYELFNAEGAKVPLAQVGQLQVRYEEATVRRHDAENFLEIMADVVDAQPQDVTLALWKDFAPLREHLPEGYRLEIGGSQEQSARAETSINKVFPLMLALMTLCIMMQMRSFSGVLVVLATAPLGVVGAVLSLLIFDQSFGFVAMLGLIGLGGILMRNTLILTQQVSDNLHNGMAQREAIIEAAVMRARPVALTALAAALAFIPLASDRFWGPMAYALIGGVLVGTLITLLFVPALYSVFLARMPLQRVGEGIEHERL